MLNRTDTNDPSYYHKVVDCQWACPAHTDVPEYIRLIAQEEYQKAYLVNRESNVFPGILGRVCDRPCEPACRRGRVEKEPVAICRLKRFAADHKGDIQSFLPSAPKKKNGKKIALIGSGPSSLTVANDLLPLGYDITLFEKENKLGGAMRSQVPGFRLPESVLDEEIGFITQMGLNIFLNHEIKSFEKLLTDRKNNWDAVFIGIGAPLGRDLNIPGRSDIQKNVFIGVEWLANIAFEHIKTSSKNVLVIGGGNTAMDCCRTALRMGAKKVWVVAPEKYEEMLASPWEKKDAEDEGVEILNNLLPVKFISENKKLKGVEFQPLISAYNKNKNFDPEFDPSKSKKIIEVDQVVLAIGQNNSYHFIEESCGIKFNQKKLPELNDETHQSTNPKVFFGGDSAFGPKNIIWAVAHGHKVAKAIHAFCQNIDEKNLPKESFDLHSQKMGVHEWTYDNSYHFLNREHVPHVAIKKRFEDRLLEVELGFEKEQIKKEVERCLNCDIQTVFKDKLCIECDACVDICPLLCLNIAEGNSEEELNKKTGTPRLHFDQNFFISDPLETKRRMLKDEDYCIHCGLCAERCPTGAWDMQKFKLKIPYAKDCLV